MALDGKAAKIDLYNDPRDRTTKDPSRIDIPCTLFIEAVERHVYGWLWECPNTGDNCKYTHALPPGYVLKERVQEIAEDYETEEQLTIEEQIEEDRAKLQSDGLHPVTKESFLEWKRMKAEKKQKNLEDKMKEEAKKGSKGSTVMSGKALFKYDPTLFQDDELAADEKFYDEVIDELDEE